MTEAQWITLLLKGGLVSGCCSIAAWIGVYTRLTRGRNFRNPIGRSLMLFAALVAALFVPFILSLFFRLNRLDSRIAAWVLVAVIGAVTPVMVSRTVVWIRESRADRQAQENGDGDGAS